MQVLKEGRWGGGWVEGELKGKTIGKQLMGLKESQQNQHEVTGGWGVLQMAKTLTTKVTV